MSETKKTLKDLKAGDEVAIVPGYARDLRYHFGYKVKKVTPKGQVVVAADHNGFELRFDADGYVMETGRPKYSRDRLEADVEVARAHTDQRARSRDAAEAILGVRVERCLATYTKESMLGQIAELEAKLATAKALVEAI